MFSFYMSASWNKDNLAANGNYKLIFFGILHIKTMQVSIVAQVPGKGLGGLSFNIISHTRACKC